MPVEKRVPGIGAIEEEHVCVLEEEQEIDESARLCKLDCLQRCDTHLALMQRAGDCASE